MKLGVIPQENNGNVFTETGNRFEHAILEKYAECLGIEIRKDFQVVIDDLMLRVNFDGDDGVNIFEVKTHKADAVKPFDPHCKYIESQCQTQMYVWKETQEDFKNLFVLEYPLYEEDYLNDNPTKDDIDFHRIKAHKMKYKKKIVEKFLDELEPLIPQLKEAKERNEREVV